MVQLANFLTKDTNPALPPFKVTRFKQLLGFLNNNGYVKLLPAPDQTAAARIRKSITELEQLVTKQINDTLNEKLSFIVTSNKETLQLLGMTADEEIAKQQAEARKRDRDQFQKTRGAPQHNNTWILKIKACLVKIHQVQQELAKDNPDIPTIRSLVNEVEEMLM